MIERYQRNVEVDDLLQIWEWCSRRLHTKWQRRRKLRNGCFYGLAYALSQGHKGGLSPMKLLKQYKRLPHPLLKTQGVIIFWEKRPMSLLELCLGAYTKVSPLTRQLNRLRASYSCNPTLDSLAKKMRSREKRFGSDWPIEGHHPDRECRLLRREMKPLCRSLREAIANDPATVGKLALDVLAKGWQSGDIPTSYYVRKTPEKLLNRVNRLKLWLAAQDILVRDLEEEEMMDVLWETLDRKITSATKTAIESQGHIVVDVVGDFIRFDVTKTRDEITA